MSNSVTPNLIDGFIQDTRTSFKKESFSGHLKNDLFRALEKSMLEGQVETACHWGAEIHCSGWADQLWEKLLIFMSRHIHLKNPTLPQYILSKFIQHYKISLQYQHQQLPLRNHSSSRKIMAHVITIMTLSKKGSMNLNRKIPLHEFNTQFINSRFEGSHHSLANTFFSPHDPMEIHAVIHELAYQLRQKKTSSALYWIHWIWQLDKVRQKQKVPMVCARRSYKMVDKKYQSDIVWLLWEAVFHAQFPIQCNAQLQSLFKLYQLDFTIGKKGSRFPILLHAIYYLTEDIKWDIPIVRETSLLSQVIHNIDKIYQEIKDNQSPFQKFQQSRTISSVLPNTLAPSAPVQNYLTYTRAANRPPAPPVQGVVKPKKKKEKIMSLESQTKMDYVRKLYDMTH